MREPKSETPTSILPKLGFILDMSLGRVFVSDLWLPRDLGISNLLNLDVN